MSARAVCGLLCREGTDDAERRLLLGAVEAIVPSVMEDEMNNTSTKTTGTRGRGAAGSGHGKVGEMDRNEAIKRIRTALKSRSCLKWSVTGGRGTAWGWITVTAPKSTLGEYGEMNEKQRDALGALMNRNGERAGRDGISIPASSEFYAYYANAAEGYFPHEMPKPYWD